MIHFLPIENIEQRYTKLMNRIVSPYCDFIYYPENFEEKVIEKGEFLDIERTIQFKAKQIEMISIAFQNNQVKNGDWFFVADIFFPGIESIKYMAELQNIEVKIAGFNHAGRADKFDFIQSLKKWSDSSELAYHDVCDLIFVGSEFHKQNIIDYFKQDPEKIIVTGCVWDTQKAIEVFPHKMQKEEFVIFPHRISPEKGVDDLLEIASLNPDMQFLITSSSKNELNIQLPKNIKYVNGLTKRQYYMYLSKAKYYLSTAYQETFGYTLREALMYDCIIAVPNRVCYPEMIPRTNLFDENKDVRRIFDAGLIMNSQIVEKYNRNVEKIISNFK